MVMFSHMLKTCSSMGKSNHLVHKLLFRWGSSKADKLSNDVLAALCAIVGESNVSSAESVREHHGRDESHHRCQPPDLVLFPGSTAEVSECARLCHEHSIPIIPYGTGTGMEGGVVPQQGGIAFDLTKMDEIVEVNEEDFDCTVEPGISRKMLNNHLRDTGLWFPVDPGADASLCGMAATSASGTNAVRYGTMRENVLNLEVVLADGTIIHTAGKSKRTRKTSAGYNLTNLIVGSEGTLGMITKATLRLYGIPEAVLSAVCSFPSIKAAVDTCVHTLQCGIPIARIELLDEIAIAACNKYSNLNYDEKPSLFLEFHGSERNVEEQAKIVGELSSMNGGGQFSWAASVEERNRLWAARHNSQYANLALRPGCQMIATDVCVPITYLPDIIEETKVDIDRSSIMGPILGHIGDGNFHSGLLVFPDNPQEMAEAKALANRMAERAHAVGGTCTGEHGIGLGKVHLLEQEIGSTGYNVMKQIKMALDPKNILNPGKVVLLD